MICWNVFVFVLLAASCPVLCSGNGQYLKGRCMCHSGWKGPECDVPTNQCVDVTCSGHGTCIVGTCICNPGYKGENCEEGKSILMIGASCFCISCQTVLFFSRRHKHCKKTSFIVGPSWKRISVVNCCWRYHLVSCHSLVSSQENSLPYSTQREAYLIAATCRAAHKCFSLSASQMHTAII